MEDYAEDKEFSKDEFVNQMIAELMEKRLSDVLKGVDPSAQTVGNLLRELERIRDYIVVCLDEEGWAADPETSIIYGADCSLGEVMHEVARGVHLENLFPIVSEFPARQAAGVAGPFCEMPLSGVPIQASLDAHGSRRGCRYVGGWNFSAARLFGADDPRNVTHTVESGHRAYQITDDVWFETWKIRHVACPAGRFFFENIPAEMQVCSVGYLPDHQTFVYTFEDHDGVAFFDAEQYCGCLHAPGANLLTPDAGDFGRAIAPAPLLASFDAAPDTFFFREESSLADLLQEMDTFWSLASFLFL